MSFLWFSKTSQKTCKNVPLNGTRSTNVIPLSLLLLDGHRRYCPLLSSSAVSCSTHRCKSNKIQVKVAFFRTIFSLAWLRFLLSVFIFFYIVLRLGVGILFKHTQKVAGWAASFSRLTWCVSPALVGTQLAVKPERSPCLHTLELHFFLLCFICNANAKETAAILHVRYQSKAGGWRGGESGGKEEDKINKTAG